MHDRLNLLCPSEPHSRSSVRACNSPGILPNKTDSASSLVSANSGQRYNLPQACPLHGHLRRLGRALALLHSEIFQTRIVCADGPFGSIASVELYPKSSERQNLPGITEPGFGEESKARLQDGAKRLARLTKPADSSENQSPRWVRMTGVHDPCVRLRSI